MGLGEIAKGVWAEKQEKETTEEVLRRAGGHRDSSQERGRGKSREWTFREAVRSDPD